MSTAALVGIAAAACAETALDRTAHTSADRATAIRRAAPADQIHLAWPLNPARTLTVVWRTRETGVPSVVQYRRSGGAAWETAGGRRRQSGTTGTLHQVTLRLLRPRTAYQYRVRGVGDWSRAYTARTAAPRGRPATFSFVYVADTGLVGRRDGLATGTRQVVREIQKLRPLLVLGGGDYAYYDRDRRYGTLDNTIDAWFNQMQRVIARAPFMPAYGNHEILLDEEYGSWAARLPTPRGFHGRRKYSFDVGNVHFVSIFAVRNHDPLPRSYVQWIARDIGAAKRRGQRWIIPYFHVSAFADGTNHPSNRALRRQLGPLFERHGVKVAISSHDQAYERSYPLRGVTATRYRRTSTAKRCYEMREGVTWVKVSPGGKLSNMNRGFSRFATRPAPRWTAYRNNRMHTFARVTVVRGRELLFAAYGVRGNGSRPVVQDRFRYTTGRCP